MTGIVIRMRACIGGKCHVMVTCIGGLIVLVDTVCRFAFLPGILNNLYYASIFASCLRILIQSDSMTSLAEMSLILQLVSIGTLCIGTSCKCLLICSTLTLAIFIDMLCFDTRCKRLLKYSVLTLAVSIDILCHICSVYLCVLLWCLLQVSTVYSALALALSVYWNTLLWHLLLLLIYSAMILSLSIDMLWFDTFCNYLLTHSDACCKWLMINSVLTLCVPICRSDCLYFYTILATASWCWRRL